MLAVVVRQVGDFETAEDAVQEAFEVALARWPVSGVPEHPRAWWVATARHKAIDRLRRVRRGHELAGQLAAESPQARSDEPMTTTDADIPDERLRLIFTCCHPALAPEAQVGLALRSLCGLDTAQIARAFLVPTATLAQRLVRAKKKIRGAGIAYEVPPPERLPERLASVMTTIYLVFNEGFSSGTEVSSDDGERCDLVDEAIRLGRLLTEQLPREREPRGLLALMLLHAARRPARVDAAGELVPLDEQDRTRWDRARIDEGLALVAGTTTGGDRGRFALEAAIAAEHARAAHAASTDWPAIVAHYDALDALEPTPVVALNRAVAVALSGRPDEALEQVASLRRGGVLDGYYLLDSTEAELLRRLGRRGEALALFRRARERAPSEAERRFLSRRIREIEAAAAGPE